MKNFGAIIALLATSAAFVAGRALPEDNSLAAREALPYPDLPTIEAREPKKDDGAAAAGNSTTSTGKAAKAGKASKAGKAGKVRIK